MPSQKYERVQRQFIDEIIANGFHSLAEGRVARPRHGEKWFTYRINATEAEEKAAPGVVFIRRCGDEICAHAANGNSFVIACDADDHQTRVTHVIQQRVK